MEPADVIIERAQTARRLIYWRLAAIALFVAAVSGPFLTGLTRHGPHAAPHIARLEIRGIIGNDTSRITTALGRAARDSSTRGLLLRIDSPGGAVVGGEALHDAIARLAARKPVVVSMGGVAASAGYMIAVPAARIFALPSTLTGSIGVILESPDVVDMLGKIGVSMTSIVSGPLKGQPSPTSHLTPEGRAMLQGVVDDMFGQFVDMVAAGRHMPVDRVRALADGRPYTGHQALALGLVDQLGDEREATAWLCHRLGASDDHPMPVRPLLSTRAGWSIHRLTSLHGILDAMPASTLRDEARLWLGLDGAIAILQP